MQILFLSQVLPYPLDAGPKMRSYYVLRYLTQHHSVTLLTFVRDSDRQQDIDHLAEFCEAVHTVPMQRSAWRDLKFLGQSWLSHQPFLIVRDQDETMADEIRQLVDANAFDVIHADQLWMAQYALLAANGDSPTAPKLILDQHNAVHLIPQRLADGESNPVKRMVLAREAQLLVEYEPEICQRFDQVVWVTSEDHQAVAALSGWQANGTAYSTVIQICADPAQADPVSRAPNARRITFLGSLHWPPNAQGILWFANEVFPLIRSEYPETLLTVIGKNPPDGLIGDGVEVTGYVTDLNPYLSETGVFIVPLHAGGGMRVKILDAWSWGLPIVSTTIGAEGIETEPEKDILMADTASAFAGAVIRILKDPAFGQRLEQNGRQTVIQKYNWQTIYEAWDQVYERMRPNTVMPA